MSVLRLATDSSDMRIFYSENPDWLAYEHRVKRKLGTLALKVGCSVQ